MKVDKDVEIIFKKNCILVFLKKELFLKQEIIKHTTDSNKNMDYTFFLTALMLYRFGLVEFN